MQKERTLQFWDDFYKQKIDDEGIDHVQEWILRTPSSILDQILEICLNQDEMNSSTQQQQPPRAVSVLEIGCGTSRLAKDLFDYWESRSKSLYNFELRVLATDVSPICITHNQQRDFGQGQDQPTNFAYATLNVAQPTSDDLALLERYESFDVILEKGFFDTILFRSRSRGSDSNNSGNPLVLSILNNIRSWLKPRYGTYVAISPRAKIKVLRDFPGFRKVEKVTLSSDPANQGDLEGRKPKADCQYVHFCTVNDSYNSKDLSKKQEQSITPSSCDLNSNSCPKCQLTFQKFQGKQTPTARLEQTWQSHKVHCKGLSA